MSIGRCAAVGLLALLLVTCGSGTAAAAPEQHNGGGHGAKTAPHDDHGAGGDHAAPNPIFAPALDLAIWTLVVFLLLLFVLRKFAWGPILQGLNKREEHIRLAVEEAKLARAETEKVRTEFKAEMEKAYAEIPRMMEEARRDAANLRDEMKSKATAEIQADRDRLRREIDTAKDQALSEIWSQAAQLATLISAKAIGRTLTDEDQRRLNEEALSQIENSGDQAQTSLRQFGEEWTRKGGGGE
jgi:F-type H+-transporting ATPase subunit b